MPTLNQDQIEWIRKDLKQKSLSRSFLYNEYVDHVCCDVEDQMNRGFSFEEAYARVTGQGPEPEIRSAQQEVQQFLNHRYVGIKKLLLFAFLLFAISWVIHVRGIEQWIGLLSFAVLTAVYFRIMLDFFAKRRIRHSHLLLGIFSLLSTLGTASGIFLLFLAWNYGINTRGHGVDLTVFGWFFFSLLCLIYYAKETKTAIAQPEIRRMKRFSWFSGIHLLLASLSIASFPLFPHVQQHLFWFILLILGVDLLMLLYLLLTRSMKHTLLASLVIGSFMIVFIHSHFRARLPGGAPKPKLHEISLQYVPDVKIRADRVYLSMYYTKFPDHPITLPMQKINDSLFEIRMPSYPYHGGLIYGIATDSVEAPVFFKSGFPTDSIFIQVPKVLNYRLK